MAKMSVIFPICNGQDLEEHLDHVNNQILRADTCCVINDQVIAYLINMEYDHIRDVLMQERETWERFQSIYWFRKYYSYLAVYDRLDDTLKKDYMDRMRQEFRRAMQTGQLDKALFTADDWKNVQSMINRSEGAASMLRSIPLIRFLAPYIPETVRCAVLGVINRVVKLKNK